MTPKNEKKNLKNIIEAKTYLGVHYMNNKEMCKAKVYFKEIISIDAENKNAKKFF